MVPVPCRFGETQWKRGVVRKARKRESRGLYSCNGEIPDPPLSIIALLLLRFDKNRLFEIMYGHARCLISRAC